MTNEDLEQALRVLFPKNGFKINDIQIVENEKTTPYLKVEIFDIQDIRQEKLERILNIDEDDGLKPFKTFKVQNEEPENLEFIKWIGMSNFRGLIEMTIINEIREMLGK